MSIQDGNPVNADYTNEKIASKDSDNSYTGKQALGHNNAESGADILDLQKTVNDLITILAIVGEGNTVSNVGGAIELFKEKVGNDLRLRTLAGTNSVTVSINGDVVEIGHPIEFLVADPSTPVAPSLWYNYTDKAWRFFDGTTTTEINSNAVDRSTNQTVGGEKTFSDNAFFSNDVTVTGKVTINGDAEIGGTLVTVNSVELEVSDAFVTINKGGTDASAESAGIEIERVSDNACITFDSTLDSKWSIGLSGAKKEIEVVVKGTEAAILATVSPDTSTRYYATDTGKNYFYDAIKSEFLEVGSGSGGVGAPDIYKVFNAEDESLTGFSNISINSVSPLAGDFAYSALSYPATFPVVDLNERSKNKLNGVSVQYKMASGTAKLVVKDNLSNTLVEQDISSVQAQEVSLQFYAGVAVTGVQLEIEDVSSSTGLIIDDVVFTDSPFVSIGLEQENSFSAIIANNGTATITTQTHPFVSSVLRTGSGIVDVNFVAGFFTEPPAIVGTSQSTRNWGVESLSTTGFVARRSLTTTGAGEDGDFYFTATNQGADYKDASENLVFSRSGTENSFSAKIEANTDVASTNVPNWLESANVTLSGSLYVIDYSALELSDPPVPFAIPDSSTAGISASVRSVTATSCTVAITNSSNSTITSEEFYFGITLQGSDYKNPNAYATLKNAMVPFSARIANNGTATITSQSLVPCISSVTRSALGIVDVVFKSGFFSTAPAVVVSVESVFDNAMISTPPTTSGVTIKTIREDGSADIDKDFNIIIQKQA